MVKEDAENLDKALNHKSSLHIKVRQYQAGDAKTVEEIEKTSIKELTPISQLALYYEIIPECFLVSEVEQKIVGYIVANLHYTPDGVYEGHILALAVHPAYRMQGVGSHLLTHVSSILKAKGAARIRLEVKVSNTAAKEFYLQKGFEAVKLVRGYYQLRGYRADAIVFVKPLETLSAGLLRK